MSARLLDLMNGRRRHQRHHRTDRLNRYLTRLVAIRSVTAALLPAFAALAVGCSSVASTGVADPSDDSSPELQSSPSDALVSDSLAADSAGPIPTGVPAWAVATDETDVSDIETADVSTLATLDEVEARLVNSDLRAAWVFTCQEELSGVDHEPSLQRGSWSPVDLAPESLARSQAALYRCGALVEELYPLERPTDEELRESYEEALEAVECFESHGMSSDWSFTWEEYRDAGMHHPPSLTATYPETPEQDAAIVDCIGDQSLVFKQ